MMNTLVTVLIAVLLVLSASSGFSANAKQEVATFAGGCFWCMEPPFEKLPGVISVTSGYTGGSTVNPTYEQVESGKTGHVEAVEVIYDPAMISYSQLLDVFWRQIDPTDSGGQFIDRGNQYRSGIFYHNEEQKRLAEQSKQALAESGMFGKPIVTEIVPASKFYRAEEYHQDFYKNHPIKYKFYRERSGRDKFLKKAWADDKLVRFPRYTEKNYRKPSKEELKSKLTPLQFKVTQEKGTEPAFHNTYWNNKREGIYVDLISGEPLFSSKDKFESGTGWPSFTKPIEPGNIVEKKERGLFGTKTEVRSRNADSYLGEVFNDGPPPTGLRYCLDSAALRFIPRENLVKEGYGQYAGLFEK